MGEVRKDYKGCEGALGAISMSIILIVVMGQDIYLCQNSSHCLTICSLLYVNYTMYVNTAILKN